jgi:lipopolysaccharide transport system permease protein
LTAIIFTIIFGLLIHVPSGDIPYPIFSFAALLPWTYFARSIERASLSVVNSANLLTKVYFPRLLIPISAALSGLVDLAISFVILVGMMIFYGYMPTLRMALLPLLVILTIVTALGVSLILSALNVYYRDVQYVVPFLIQLWMYASPIIYPIVLIPERFRLFYGLNPMVSVIEGFRWALFNYKNPIDTSMIFSASIAIGLFIFGLMIFRRMEDTFADVI